MSGLRGGAVIGCRCGFKPCAIDHDAAIEALWDHIESAHTNPTGVRLVAGHQGGYQWRNTAELVWECADDCPHPSHRDQP